MNHSQILEQLLSFSLQQHVIKDKQIEDLQKQVADFNKAQVAQQEAKPVLVPKPKNLN